MVHFRLRRECLTVNSIRSLGGVESCHSATTTGGQARNSHDHNFRQVNIHVCHHLQLSLNARSCICEGIRSTVGHSVATMDYL